MFKLLKLQNNYWNYFGMITVSILSKLLASLTRNYFPKRASGALLNTLSKLYEVPVGFVPPSFEDVYCHICSRRRVALARYRMICLVLVRQEKEVAHSRDACEVTLHVILHAISKQVNKPNIYCFSCMNRRMKCGYIDVSLKQIAALTINLPKYQNEWLLNDIDRIIILRTKHLFLFTGSLNILQI